MDEEKKQSLLESAAHWDGLAETLDEMTRWRIENNLSHLVCSADAYKAAMFRSTAERLRLQAEDGIQRCHCHSSEIHERDKCPNDPANVRFARR